MNSLINEPAKDDLCPPQAVRELCMSAHANQPTTWLSQLNDTSWLLYVSAVMKASVRCARALEEEARPVVVHCSGGWDRTPQVVSLAEIMLDPYYRL